MDSQLPRFVRSPTPCALADEPAGYFRDAPRDLDEPAEYFRDGPTDSDEPSEYFRDAPVDLDESAEFFREAPVDSEESAELFREAPTESHEPAECLYLSALEEPLIGVDQTADYIHPDNVGMFDSIEYQIFSQVQPQIQLEIGQSYNQAELPNVKSPFQPSRPMNALLQPMQTPVPMSNPQMAQMGFCEPQDTNIGSQQEGTPFLGDFEDSIESRLMQAMMIEGPDGNFNYATQNQGQIQGQIQNPVTFPQRLPLTNHDKMAISKTLTVLLLMGATAQALALPSSYPSASSDLSTPTIMEASATATATDSPAFYLRPGEQSTDGHFEDIYINQNGDLVPESGAGSVVEKRFNFGKAMQDYQAKQAKGKVD